MIAVFDLGPSTGDSAGIKGFELTPLEQKSFCKDFGGVLTQPRDLALLGRRRVGKAQRAAERRSGIFMGAAVAAISGSCHARPFAAGPVPRRRHDRDGSDRNAGCGQALNVAEAQPSPAMLH